MKTRVKVLFGLLVLILVAGIAAGIIHERIERSKDPEYIFTYAENQSAGYPTSQGAYYFANLVEERTNGKIKILVYTDAKLGREADIISQMRYGGIDFARVSLSQIAEVDPSLNVLQMPYLYNDSKHMWNVLDGEIGNSFLEGVKDYNLVGLSWYDAGARNFYNSEKPITCTDDMKGMKIRVQQSELMQDMVECLGAEAVPLSYEEVYAALDLKTIQGAENNWPSYEDTGHYKVARYITEDEHTRVPEMQLCAAHTWEFLSDEYKEIISECAKESALYERKLWSERVEESKNRAIEYGVIVNTFSSAEKQKIREMMSPVYEKYCSEYMDILNEIIKVGSKGR